MSAVFAYSVASQSNAPAQIKAAPGSVVGYDLGTDDPNGALVYLFDSASSPTLGVTQPLLSVSIPKDRNSEYSNTSGIPFANGLWIIIMPAADAGVLLEPVNGHIEFT